MTERLFNLGDVRLIMLVHCQRIEILTGIFLNLQKLLLVCFGESPEGANLPREPVRLWKHTLLKMINYTMA